MNISEMIEERFVPGVKIPKPVSEFDYYVKGWGIRRGERALIYYIPNHKNPAKPYEKGITISEFQIALERIQIEKDITREWFNKNLARCNKEGTCNYTTLGGIFEKLGFVEYVGDGVYKVI
jgi:hypothetical protein